ncbi:hypothetical protein DFH09DRAFT_1338713 [Mycena vulgaris]|nr:hypothetical protein DFH09DRAFT_1338713 [Mycena vulgaris]
MSCIAGVLTKPDRIPRGDEENWLPLIRNEQESLENNWCCAKQPSSQDLKQGITWEEARTCENNFFSLTPPWPDLDPIIRSHFEAISANSDRAREHEKTRAGLQALPKPPSSDPISEITTMLHNFVGDLHKLLEGISRADGLLQIIRLAQE